MSWPVRIATLAQGVGAWMPFGLAIRVGGQILRVTSKPLVVEPSA